MLLTSNSFSAGSSGGDGGSMKSNYEKAVTLVKSAKKLEKKGKMDKAKDKYQKDQINREIEKKL